ncbi:MAG: bifunctional UDP-3-O-[3-hydroxymyristoyl] N-acetylglucosamine deacetylase/3-hydroxyacyl-ACP dehydratase [Saprospiraceae bacterium]|nr:bifunctional UDP-3-O-[3-hydroxymyristoyl] N-acetylglucosamine deacetylase/3-hydroxyacyl-ACP dehydratase [Saprospiraceae bacterium]
MNQQTIKSTLQLNGVGLHTGKAVALEFFPAEVNHGIKFRRVDLEDQPILKADVGLVDSTNRGTCLKSKDVEVHTVEHLMSALIALGVDNVMIDVNGPEIPIMDGSAKMFFDAIKEVGLKEQDKERDYFVVEEPIFFKDDNGETELIALPYDGFQVTTMIDFNSKVLGTQHAQLNSLDDYESEIASCRTFVFLHELEALFDQGLVRGGDLDNAVVLVDKVLSEEALNALAEKIGKPGIKVESEGVLNTTDLYFRNEPARHKLLDVIGDLGLIGAPIKGKIITNRPGHTANVQFARVLKKAYLMQKKSRNIPKYDPNIEPIYDVNQIQELLPHRFPFLMIDKIIEVSENHVVGVKNVTMNEHLFQGHFPGNPIFPGVLQVEAMAQTGGILALLLQEDQKGWDTYFLKINNTKFKGMVRPGDTLVFKLELMAPIKRGIVQMYGAAYVGGKLVSEGEFTAQIVQRK